MKFSPTKYKVSCCGDVIWSRFPGEFRKCHCGQTAIDETEHYARMLGNITYFVKYKEEDGEEGGAN